MEIGEVKAALGKKVRFRDDRLFCDGDYILTETKVPAGYQPQAERYVRLLRHLA